MNYRAIAWEERKVAERNQPPDARSRKGGSLMTLLGFGLAGFGVYTVVSGLRSRSDANRLSASAARGAPSGALTPPTSTAMALTGHCPSCGRSPEVVPAGVTS